MFGNALGVATDLCGRKPWLTGALFAYFPVYVALIITWYNRPRFEQDIPNGWTNVTSLGAPLAGKVLIPCRQTPTYNFTQIEYGFAMHDCEYQPTIIAYYLCYIILGIFTPYQPHAIGYISDISPPKDLPSNQSWLAAFGFYLGLFGGFVLALLTYVIFGALRENQDTGFTGNFIPASLVLAILVVFIGIDVHVVLMNRLVQSYVPKIKKNGNVVM
jgi:MFS family permease